MEKGRLKITVYLVERQNEGRKISEQVDLED